VKCRDLLSLIAVGRHAFLAARSWQPLAASGQGSGRTGDGGGTGRAAGPCCQGAGGRPPWVCCFRVWLRAGRSPVWWRGATLPLAGVTVGRRLLSLVDALGRQGDVGFRNHGPLARRCRGIRKLAATPARHPHNPRTPTTSAVPVRTGAARRG